jgi:hypothetical protein
LIGAIGKKKSQEESEENPHIKYFRLIVILLRNKNQKIIVTIQVQN